MVSVMVMVAMVGMVSMVLYGARVVIFCVFYGSDNGDEYGTSIMVMVMMVMSTVLSSW